MYKNIQSKVYNQPKIKNDIPHPINNSKRINKYNEQKGEKPNKIVRPNSASAKTLNIQYGNQNTQKPSMFDEYYKNKINNHNYDIYPKNNNYSNEEEIKNQISQEEHIDIKNQNNNLEKNKIKNVQRPLTAKTNNLKQKDFLADSKYIISCIQKANNNNKFKKANSKEKAYHREYGKTPKYIQNMKIEAEKKKEIEKLKKETSKYPKGTRLLSEEERLFTLEKLKQSKNDINQIIEKLPITCDSQAFRNKKEELFKKLDEIENAIETFSKKKVFVKIEEN